MTIYGVDDMQPFYADVISREISPAEILDIADLIEEKYDRDADHQAITYWLYGWLFEKMSCRQTTVFEDYIRTN